MTLLPISLDLRDLLGRGLFLARELQIGHLNFPVPSQHDVGTATGHVGGDGQRTRAAGLGNNFSFFLVEFGIEHLVRNVFLIKQA